MTPRAVLTRAAALLDEDADAIAEAHTLNGAWVVLDNCDTRAEADYNERMGLAAKLRLMAGSC